MGRIAPMNRVGISNPSANLEETRSWFRKNDGLSEASFRRRKVFGILPLAADYSGKDPDEKQHRSEYSQAHLKFFGQHFHGQPPSGTSFHFTMRFRAKHS